MVVALVATGRPAQGQTTRIVAAIKDDQRTAVKGTTPPLVAKSADKGRMSGSQNLGKMVLLLSPTATQDTDAQQLIEALHDPSSPYYHKWLTPAEFGRRFGVSPSDAAQVGQWLGGQGLTVHETSQSSRFIVFSGNVSQVEKAFATQMHSYVYNGKDFVSNSADIRIPAALQSVVKGVVRLHSDPRSPSLVLGGKIHFTGKPGHFTFDDGSHLMTPADFAKIYNIQPLYDAGIDGTGQTIAIVGRSNIDVQNIRDFRSILGLPANDPEVVVNGDDPGQANLGDMAEALLDVTWSGAVAPMAHIKFVVSQSNFSDGVDVSAAYIVDHNLAPVMSTSFGSCEKTMGPVEAAFYNSLWQQAAAQGITSFVSTGDAGGAGCDAPDVDVYASGGLAVSGLASTPYNVAVGGSQFDDTDNPDAYWTSTTDPTTGLSALGYIPEKVWNESTNDPNGVLLYSGGGGVSTLYAKPNWQSAPGVPNDGKRDLPDLSLSASLHDGYLVCMFSNCEFGDYFYYFGGTSASSPAAAGIMALVNQKMGGQPQGLANYVFYKLASVPGVYHDITKGDNKVPDDLGQYTVGYSATPGYDPATGLGSLDVNALVNNWKNAASTKGSALTLKLANGQSMPVVHGTAVNFQAKVTCTGTCSPMPGGTVSIAATSPSGDYVASGSGQLNASATANIQTQTLPGGTYGVTARYDGDGTYFASTSGPVQVTITPETSQTYVGAMAGGSFTTAPISVGYGLPLNIGVAVVGNSGHGYPSGQVALLADGQPANTVSFDPGTGTTTPSPLILNYGEKTSLILGGSTPASQSSTVSYLPPTESLSAGPHQLQASYPGDSSFSASQSTTYGFTVTKADSVIADFFPIGTPVVGVPVQLAGEVAFKSYGFAPYTGTITITDLTGPAPVKLGSGNITMQYGGSYGVNVTFTSPGTHLVQVTFSGDSNVNPVSQTYHLPVNSNVPSSTSLSVDLPTATAGTPVTLTAMVTSDVTNHPATGTITFLDGSATVGTATLDSTGTATFVAKSLSGGPHSITANYPGDAVITGSVSDPIIETITDYVVQALPATLTIKEGGTGTATLNIIPVGGFSQPVQVSCGTLPAGVSCSFSQSSVTPDGVHPSTVMLQVKTNGTLAGRAVENHLLAVGSTFALAGVMLPFGRRRKLRITLATVVLVGMGLCMSACGGGRDGQTTTPVGSVTVNVMASSGSPATAKTASLAVNIVK